MSIIPGYTHPDFTAPGFSDAPVVSVEPAPADGVVPSRFHGTSNHPEYLHLGDGRWLLVPESRMDSVLVLTGDVVEAMEARRVRKGYMFTQEALNDLWLQLLKSFPFELAEPVKRLFPAAMMISTMSCAMTATTAISSGSSDRLSLLTKTAATPCRG